MQTCQNNQKSLLKYLSKIKDPRRSQGQRHSFEHILLITIMGIMSGYIGYRAIGDFIKANKDDLLAVLQPKKNKLPSFDVVRKVLIAIDFDELSKCFYEWAQQHIVLQPKEWVSVDGKAICGTLEDSNGNSQSFTSLVSVYCSKQQLVLCNSLVTSKKDVEMSVVQNLMTTLHLKDVFFTLDALHCQKKQL
jgi:hypothetical protein